MTVSSLLDAADATIHDAILAYKRLSAWERFNWWRTTAIVCFCVVVIFIFGMDLVLAEQSTIQPQSVYDVQQYEELKSTKEDVEMLKQRLAQIESDRQRRRDEAETWRQEMRDRLTRVETVGSVAVIGIGLLNTLGFLRKPKGEKQEDS